MGRITKGQVPGLWQRPKPTPREVVTVDGTPEDPPSVRFPLANLGVPIPYVIGRQRIMAPNIMWLGNVRPVIREDKEVIEDEAGNITIVITKSIVGYYVSMQFALCLGPGVVLRAIYADNVEIWTGSVGPDRATFTIPANDSYIDGDVIFLGGDFDQAPDVFLQDFISDSQLSGYPGICYIILKDVRLDELGGSISFEVERYPDPLSLAAENKIGDDINVASALVDFLTSDWGGCGVPIANVNTAQIATKADVLFDESNGCSLYLQQQAQPAQIINILTDQMDGCVFENPSSGQIELALYRKADFDPVTARRFTPDSVTSFSNIGRNAWPGTMNKLAVSFTSRAKAYDSDSVLGYSKAAARPGLKSTRAFEVDYPAVMVASLASNLLVRDLSRYSKPITIAQIETDRGHYDALPGDAAVILMTDDNVFPVSGYIDKVQKSDLQSNKVVVSFVSYTIIDNAISFGTPEIGIPVPIDLEAKNPTVVHTMPIPFWIAAQSRTADERKEYADQPLASALSIFRTRLMFPVPLDEFQTSVTVWGYTPEGDPFAERYDGAVARWNLEYPAYGELAAAIDRYDNADTFVIPTLTLDLLRGYQAASIGKDGIRAGELFMIVSNSADIKSPANILEVMSFESVAQTGTVTYEFTNVHRGLMGTVPIDHPIGSYVHIISGLKGRLDPAPPGVNPPGGSGGWASTTALVSPYAFGAHPNLSRFKVTGNALTLRNDPDVGTPVEGTYAGFIDIPRLPYSPALAQIEGVARSADAIPLVRNQDFDVTWKVRSRFSETVRLPEDASDEPEVDAEDNYMRHRVLITDSGSTSRDCGVTSGSDPDNDSLTATVPSATALGAGNAYVRAEYTYFSTGGVPTTGSSAWQDLLPVYIYETLPYVAESDEAYYISEDGQFQYIQE